MTADHTPNDRLARLAALYGPRKDLPADTPTLAQAGVGHPATQDLFSDLARCNPRLDGKGLAAIAAHGFGHAFGDAIMAQDLNGRDVTQLSPGDIQVSHHLVPYLFDGQEEAYVGYHVGFDAPAARTPVTTEALGRALASLLTPAVRAISDAGGLGHAAIWRLLADAVAWTYLNAGRELGAPALTETRIMEALKLEGSPLSNPQLRFVTITVDVADSPTGQTLCKTFRLRGGCCRYYLLEEHDLCTTCVLHKDPEAEVRAHLIRDAREKMLASRAAADAGDEAPRT